MRNLAVLALVIMCTLTTACTNRTVNSAASGQDPAVQVEDPPVLRQLGSVFVYETPRPRISATIRHEVRLDGGITLVLVTPQGWTSRRVGNAAWLAYGETGGRFVVYPPEQGTHEERIREFYALDRGIRGAQIGHLQTFPSARQPFLYIIERTRRGRSGLVYGVLTEPGNINSGIVVTGIWPTELHDQLRP
ncbi:hypothetical protein KKC47_00065, partial [Patescibacteria group bacterium]|nr:hypothetical protein [Patescibacteria group bacterium]